MYIQLRVTPEFCEEPEICRPHLFLPDVLEYLEKYGEVENYAWCAESKNKFGEATHPHYHINIVAYLEDFNKQSFQAWFRRRPMLPKGNKCYAISLCGDPEDEDRWWRYLLKDQPSTLQHMGCKEHLPAEFRQDLETHWRMACDERKLQVQRNLAARDRALQNDSFRLRCYNAVHEHNPSSDREIFASIIRYYMSNNKVPPFNTGMNMVYDYKCTFNLMSPEEYYDMRYNSTEFNH